MSWKEKMREFGGGDLAFLSEDGEVVNFVVVGEPVKLEGKYKGQPSTKIGCPVVTEDGFQLLVAGKRLARKISKHESEFKTHAFVAIRHGGQDDPNTTYDLQVINDDEKTKQLIKLAKVKLEPSVLQDAIEAAQDVMKG